MLMRVRQKSRLGTRTPPHGVFLLHQFLKHISLTYVLSNLSANPSPIQKAHRVALPTPPD